MVKSLVLFVVLFLLKQVTIGSFGIICGTFLVKTSNYWQFWQSASLQISEITFFGL